MLENKNNKEYLEKYKEIIRKNRTKCRSFQKSNMISKSTVSRIRNNYENTNKNNSYKQKLIDESIIEIFNYFKGNIGREVVCERLSRIVFTDLHGQNFISELTSRQVGNRMNKLKLFCNIRRNKKKQKEIKDVMFKCPNLVNRDYNNINHNDEILATDVTYLPPTKDALFNNTFLSVVISHKTKEIVGWSLSEYNNVNLVIDSLKEIKFKQGTIIHSDHGNQYSSNWFNKFIKANNLKQSMSRVGNSLDNRVVEFFFSIFKTEFISKKDVRSITTEELRKEISNYMKYYNEVRIQHNLNWMPPKLYRYCIKDNNELKNIKILN